MSQEKWLVKIEGLTVGYEDSPVVEQVNLSIRRGEILTLIGPNGAGKTTLLKSIIGQLERIAGVVWLEEQDLLGMSVKERAKKMSVVLTESVRTEWMTVWDIVAMGRYPYTGTFGILGEEDRQRVLEAMEFVQIGELKDKIFSKISDGQKQRVLLARAICQEPEVLVLDEPTSFLDIRYKLEFLSLLQTLVREKNIAVLMSLHELDLAKRISHQIACVKEKKLWRVGTPKEVFEKGFIKNLYELSVGSFEEESCNVELQKVEGNPKVFVIAGGGAGTEIYRQLQRKGVPFCAGILWENDVEYPVAKALAVECLSVKAFSEVDKDTLDRAKGLMKQCEQVIVALDLEPLGRQAEPLRELEKYARAYEKVN